MTERSQMPKLKIDRRKCRRCRLCNIRFPALLGGNIRGAVCLPAWTDLALLSEVYRLIEDCPDAAVTLEEVTI